MLNLVVARHLRLAVIVDQDHALFVHHLQQLFQALHRPIAEQYPFGHPLTVLDREWAVRQGLHVHGPIIILRGE